MRSLRPSNNAFRTAHQPQIAFLANFRLGLNSVERAVEMANNLALTAAEFRVVL